MRAVVVLLFVFLGYVLGQSFQANFVVKNDPLIIGNMRGIINYDAPNKIVRTDFFLPSGNISEIFDYNKHLRYLKCTVCETSTNNAPMSIYYQGPGATNAGAVTINGIATTSYNIPNNPVRKVYISAGNIIRAEYAPVNGLVKTIDFSGHRVLAPASYFDPAPWNCPQQKCAKAIDMMLVFDESGSIKAPDFRRELDFGVDLANFYTFGPDAVQMGFVQFDTTARLTAQLTPIKTNFVNQVRAANQRGKNTCIACGMAIAWEELKSGRSRSKATKVMITLTDGQANEQFNGRNLASVAAEVKNAGVTCFGIGVGDVKPDEINTASSSIPGVQTSFPAVPNFSTLNSIIQSLATATCVDIPGTPCGAGCKGFCSCGGKCLCPTDCDDGDDVCTVENCVETANGAGCFYSNTCTPGSLCRSKVNPDGENCNDFNACTDETCDANIGCVRKNVTCTSTNPCITSTCNTALGCQDAPTDCFAVNPRFVELVGTCYLIDCSPAQGGCYITPIEGTFIDDCGICNGTNACKVPPLPDSVPYALSGGALAAVVIFAAIAAAALGAAGGKTGYNIWMNHRNHISGAQTSPLYTDSGLTGNSPLYKA